MAADDVLQAILEQRAAEKRAEMAAVQGWGSVDTSPAIPTPVVLPFARQVENLAPATLPFAGGRIAGAFDVSQGMAEPTRALYAAKHRRAQEYLDAQEPAPPVEPRQGLFTRRDATGVHWSPGMPGNVQAVADMARAAGQSAAAAPGAFYNDPLGSLNRVGLVGQGVTDALLQGAVQPFIQFNDPNVPPEQQAFNLASVAGGGPGGPLTLLARGRPVASTVVRELPNIGDQLRTLGAVEPVPGRISTKLSSAEKKNPTHTLSIGAEDVINGHVNKAGYSNMDLVRGYPGMAHMRDAPREMDRAVANEFMSLNAENLLWLYSKMPGWKDRAKNWYVGANRLAKEWALKHGIDPSSVAGALAALSPKADWFRNASYAERILDMTVGKNAGKPWSQEMQDLFDATPSLHTYKTLEVQMPGGKKGEKITRNVLEEIKGKKLDQLDLNDDYQRGLWMMLYDRAHNPKNYRMINPEGDLGPFATNLDGGLSEIGTASVANMTKADRSIRSGGNLNIISPLMGEAHKVRNFFNNINVPWDRIFRDATIDTHQVAAGHLLPLGQQSELVGHTLGSLSQFAPRGSRPPVNSTASGVKGTYGLGIDSLRHAADIVGLLPRELQSSAWEAIKALFSPEAKRDMLFVPELFQLWNDLDASNLTGDALRAGRHAVRERIFDRATDGTGTLRLPRWARRDFKKNDPRTTSTY